MKIFFTTTDSKGFAISENVVCGGKSFINKNCKKNSVYFGIPLKFIKKEN